MIIALNIAAYHFALYTGIGTYTCIYSAVYNCTPVSVRHERLTINTALVMQNYSTAHSDWNLFFVALILFILICKYNLLPFCSLQSNLYASPSDKTLGRAELLLTTCLLYCSDRTEMVFSLVALSALVSAACWLEPECLGWQLRCLAISSVVGMADTGMTGLVLISLLITVFQFHPSGIYMYTSNAIAKSIPFANTVVPL